MANATETKFGDPEQRIAQTAYWTLLLRPKQVTLGALVLVCREPVTAFGALSAEAYADLGRCVARIEPVLREFCSYERINYLMLMMVDPDVHFHVLPRYAGTRRFAEVDYTDAGWPGPPDLNSAVTPSAAASAELVARLRHAWHQQTAAGAA